MADRLEVDIAFNSAEADAAIARLSQELGQVGDVLSQSLGAVIAQMGSLGDSVPTDQASQVADALNDAAGAAANLGSSLDVDPSGATDLADAFEEASTASHGLGAAVGDVVSLSGDAADAAQSVADSLNDAATAAGDVAAGTSDIAATSAKSAEASAKQADAANASAAAQKSQGAAVDESANKFGLLGLALSKTQAEMAKLGAAGQHAIGPLKNLSAFALTAVKGMSGTTAAIGALFVAGVGGLISKGEEWKKLQNVITAGTGATGERLESLSASLAKVASTSGRAPSEVAGVLSVLNRDLGLTGEALEKATAATSGFVKATSASVDDVRGMGQAMKALGVASTDVVKFQDELTAAQKAFGGNIAQLMSQVKVAGPALANFGLSSGQIIGLTAQFDQAGLPINRMVVGFTKLAVAAQATGMTGSQAFADLIDRIKGTNSAQEALSVTQGIFSGRVATQLIAAVKNGSISLEEINAVMERSPGITAKVAGSMAVLGQTFAKIRNDFTVTLGTAGIGVAEGLTTTAKLLVPIFHSLFAVISSLTPVFKGFALTALGPIAIALKLVAGPLESLASLFAKIPGPVLQMVGAFVLLRAINFQSIAVGALNMAKAFGTAISSIGSAGAYAPAAAGLGRISSAFSAVGVAGGAAIVAVGAFAIYQHVMGERAKNAREELEALNKALGDTAVATDEAAGKVAEMGKLGSLGKLFSDNDLKRLETYGLTIDQIVQDATSQARQGGRADVGKVLADQIVATEGGMRNLIETDLHLSGSTKKRALAMLDSADGTKALTDELRDQGTVLGEEVRAFDSLEDRANSLSDAMRKAAEEEIKELVTRNANGGSLLEEAKRSLAVTDIKGHEIIVRDALVRAINKEKLEKAGLTDLTAQEIDVAGEFLGALEEAGGTQDELNKKLGAGSAAMLALSDATREGTLSDGERYKLAKQFGLEAPEFAKAEEAVTKIRAEWATTSAEATKADIIFFQGVARGLQPVDALGEAVRFTGVNMEEMSDHAKSVTDALKKYETPVRATVPLMELINAKMRDGAPIADVYAAALEKTGGNAAMAIAGLDEYQAGVQKTNDVLDGLGKKASDVTDQLLNPEKDTSALKSFDDEAKAVRALTDARVSDLDFKITNAMASRDAAAEIASAAGQQFNPAALDAYIGQLQTNREQVLSELDTNLEGVKSRSAAMADAITAAGEAPLSLDAVMTNFQSELSRQMAETQTIVELESQGFTNTLQFLFDPARGFDPGQQSAYLEAIAGMSASGKAELEAQAKQITDAQDAIKAEAQKAGDIFEKSNPAFVEHAETRGRELAYGLRDGVVDGMDESHIQQIIDLALTSGANPKDIAEIFGPVGAAAGKSLADEMAEAAAFDMPGGGGKPDPFNMAGVQAALDQKGAEIGVSTGLGLAEQFKGALAADPFTVLDVKDFTDALWDMPTITGQQADAATGAMHDAINANPMTAEEGTGLVDPMRPWIIQSGHDSGIGFNTSVADGAKTPLDAVGISASLVGSVKDQMGIEGGLTGAAFAQGVAGGVAQYTPEAVAAITDLVGQALDAGNAAGLVQSPSKKTWWTGQMLAKGIAGGIRESSHEALKAAEEMVGAVSGLMGGTTGKTTLALKVPDTVALGDGPGVDRIVRAVGGLVPARPARPRRRRPFEGNR